MTFRNNNIKKSEKKTHDDGWEIYWKVFSVFRFDSSLFISDEAACELVTWEGERELQAETSTQRESTVPATSPSGWNQRVST